MLANDRSAISRGCLIVGCVGVVLITSVNFRFQFVPPHMVRGLMFVTGLFFSLLLAAQLMTRDKNAPIELIDYVYASIGTLSVAAIFNPIMY